MWVHKGVIMKSTATVILFLTAFPLGAASAETLYTETIVHETTTSVDLELNEETVLCSQAEYGVSHLKVLIPQLAAITLLDHQNQGAGAPCVTAGACAPNGELETGQVLDDDYDHEQVSILVRAVRIDVAESSSETCTTYLREEIETTIGGLLFTHERSALLGERSYSDCVAGEGDDKADDKADDTADDNEESAAASDEDVESDSQPRARDVDRSGGCEAAGTGNQLPLVWPLALAFVLMFLSRKRPGALV
jgi:hypothetical protein